MFSACKRFSIGLLALVAVGIFQPHVDAALTLTVSDNAGNSMTVVDGDSNDQLGLAGGITWAGPLGLGNVTWMINCSTGIVTSTDPASLHFSSLNVTGGNGGVLTIMLSNNGFTSSTSGLVADVGGVVAAGGSLQASAYLNDSNVLFDIASAEETATFSGFSSGAFSGHVSQAGNVSGPFSMTLKTVISHSPNQAIMNATSFDFGVSAVPEPGTLAIWSVLAVPGLGCLVYRRSRR